MKIRTLVITAMLATVASPGFAQVNYDSMRSVRDLVEEFSGGVAGFSWSIRDEEDSFTRETRRYVTGWGGQGLLFIVASCDSLSVLFRNRTTIFGSGKIESIWDNGDIVEHQFDDRDSMLVDGGTDWLRLLTGHDELRVRVTAYPESVASDEFDLQAARMPKKGDVSAYDVGHVRELFSEIGCAFE